MDRGCGDSLIRFFVLRHLPVIESHSVLLDKIGQWKIIVIEKIGRQPPIERRLCDLHDQDMSPLGAIESHGGGGMLQRPRHRRFEQ